MNVPKEELEERMARFEEVCRKSGAKLTHQRMEIFREIAKTGKHPDADTVFHGVRKRIPMVSMDTVYRTLWWLKDLGMITTLGPPRERARFDANLSRHHHFVCVHCGLTLDFYSDKLNRLALPDSIPAVGYVKTAQVEVQGVCLECATKEQSD